MRTVAFHHTVEHQEGESFWVTYGLEVRASVIRREVIDLTATITGLRAKGSPKPVPDTLSPKHLVGDELSLQDFTPKEQSDLLTEVLVRASGVVI